MSTPVATDKWAGNFDCSVCRRKRLVGSEFSKKALDRHRKTGVALKCKRCTSDQEEKERLAAAAKAAAKPSNNSNNETDERATCAACKESLLASRFNRNQLSKKDKARCRRCVEQSVQAEEESRKSSQQHKLQEVKQKILEADTKGNMQEKLKYESQLSALEAEHVTGLKPVIMGRGRGRGRGSWRGRGRGQVG
eukprot:CAMPEP_0196151866 /NCGR_PEP_ID=MMETSP0910-20130528/34447_1 /TAXON_ID=49265 /ORGANISM="Thalassiosira rotula, Strain GSO102" /LENGTH=193 /DNA_ID=CAMNT_0041415331 /DNA_START=92 /DNA_END=669 /DNA_ORIENTATION=+